MRILMTIAELGSGGAEAVVADLGIDLAGHGHQVTVATSGGWRVAGLDPRVRVLDVPLRSARPDHMLASAAAIRWHAHRAPVDVVHAHNVRATLVAHLGTRWPRRRPLLLATVHGLDAADYPRAARVLTRCADRVAAVSRDTAERLADAGVPRERIAVVENAVAVPPAHDRADARRRLSLPPDAPVVLCAARLAPPKRHDLLIRAWQRLPADAVLLVAGDGPLRGELADAVTRAGLAGRVRLLGDRRDLDWLLSAADVLVLPSDREGLPMSVLEAMAAGVPVVASAVGGLVEVGDGAIELVAAGSVDALAAALTGTLTDATRRGALIEAGLALTNGRFAAAGMRARYRELYEHLANIGNGRTHEQHENSATGTGEWSTQ